MATVTLRPDGTSSAGSPAWVAAGGAASLHAATNDNNDATYAQGPVSLGQMLLDFGTFVLPPLGQIRSVATRLRANQPTGAQNLVVIVTQSGFATGVFAQSPSTVITDYAGTVLTTKPGGGSWDQASIDVVQLAVNNQAGGNHRVYELYLDVLYNLRPSATVTAPTGAQTTNTPTVVWSYSDPEGDVQERYQVRVFDVATYSGPGFDPSTSTPIYDSGNQTSSANSQAVFPALASGTYKAYVRVSDVGSGFVYGDWGVGPVFTIASGDGFLFDPPAVPQIVSAAPVAETNRVAITIQGRDNELTRNQSSSEVGPLGWAADANVASLLYENIVGVIGFSGGHGAGATRLTSTGSGDMRATTPAGVSGFPVLPNKPYTAEVWFARGLLTVRSVRSLLRWYTSAGALISTVTGSSVTENQLAEVQTLAAGTSPVNAAYAAVVAEVLATGGASETHWIDKARLSPGSLTTWTRGGFVREVGSMIDAFARTDSASSLGTAPTGGAWVPLLGTWGLTGQRAYQASATAQGSAALVTSLLTDGVLEADITLSPTTDRTNAGFILRGIDSSNYLLIRVEDTASNNGVFIDKRVATVHTTLASSAALGLVAGTTYHVKVEFFSRQIRVYVDDVLRLEHTMTAANHALFATSTSQRYGLRVNNAALNDDGGTRFDNFSVRLIKTQGFVVERSIDDEETWQVVRSINGAEIDAVGQLGVLYDYEAPRDRPVAYRAYTTASEAGIEVASGYSEVAWLSPVLASDGNAWLKSGTDSSLQVTVCHATHEFSSESEEDQGVFWAEGRRTPVIMSGTIRSEKMTIDLLFRSDAEWDDFETLRNRQEPLLFQTCYGDDGLDQYWVRLGKRTVTRLTTDPEDMRANQLRQVRVEAWEVASPAVT